MTDGIAGAARALIEELGLAPHPEGGYFRETIRSDVSVDAHGGTRSAVTSILFLLPTGHRSRNHRVRSDEIWLHHGGDDVGLTVEGHADVRVGASPGAALQTLVPAGAWQAAEALPGPHGYALVGCVVAPGFDFADFELEDA
ncbi:MAG: cupin domain-containing protein [Planctomycetota bacterium]